MRKIKSSEWACNCKIGEKRNGPLKSRIRDLIFKKCSSKYIHDEHHSLYEEAVQLAARIGLEPKKPRALQRQVHISNLPSTSIANYLKLNLTAVFLYHFLVQLDTRFPTEIDLCYEGFAIVPSVLLCCPSSWKTSVNMFCDARLLKHNSLPIFKLVYKRLIRRKKLLTNKVNEKSTIVQKIQMMCLNFEKFL